MATLFIYNMLEFASHSAAYSVYSENSSQFNLNCTSFTVDDLKFLNRLRNIPALVCSVITLVILIFLVCSKAFSTLFKRLYFYLVLGTLCTELALGLNIEHQWYYKGQETVCVWLGFFTQWTCVVVFILSYEIVLHLLCLVVSQVRGSQPFPRCTGSRYFTVILEIMYILTPVAIATGLAVMPYVKKGYGVAGPWCWVQSLNEDCEPAGLVTQMVFYGMYVSVGVVGIAASFVFSLIYFRIASSFRNARYLLKQTFYVMLFQIVHILIIMCNLTLRIYTLLSRRHQLYGFWMAHAFTIPFGVLVFPLGYLLCFYPVKQVLLKPFRKITAKCCKRRMSAHQVEVPSITRHTTAPRSDRVSQPSDTFFVVPHPDDFTETSPILASDTGYDSNNTFLGSQCK